MVQRALHIGGGLLSIGPKPKPHKLPESVGAVVTLIQEREGATALGDSLLANGISSWQHFPFTTRDLRAVDPVVMLESFQHTMDLLQSGIHVHVHCLEGLHRSGMYTYGLLRMTGCDQFDAMDVLSMLRPESARALTTSLREWVETTIKRGFRKGWRGSLKS